MIAIILTILLAANVRADCYVKDVQSYGADTGFDVSHLDQLNGTLTERLNENFRINGARACKGPSGLISGTELQISEKVNGFWENPIILQSLGDTTTTCDSLGVLPSDHITRLDIEYTTSTSGGVVYIKFTTLEGAQIETGL